MNKITKKGIILAILAATLYAINAPLSKLLLEHISPKIMAGFLYLGAGFGMYLKKKSVNDYGLGLYS